MARRAHQRESGSANPGGARRLIAGLRVTTQDEALLAVVRPYLADVGSEGELAYRLWRRGLELALAEAASVGAALPPGCSEELIAGLVTQRLLLCMPLLRHTGKLAILGLEAPHPQALASAEHHSTLPLANTVEIDEDAAGAITSLGGSEFL